MGFTNHCNLSNEALEWLNGELLGDGSLSSRSSVSAYFTYSSKYLEYINYVSDALEQFGIRQCGKIQSYFGCSLAYHYRSLSYNELFPVWMSWYMYGGKQVPKDIELTPLVCRQWYIGDGCLKKSGGSIGITLATMGFPSVDNLWLVMKLKKLGFHVNHQPAWNELYISAHSVKDFLTYIGECPVECYKYKWDY